MSVANLYFIPLCLLFIIASVLILACFLKLQSLRKYRKKRNWLVYASIVLVVGLLAYQIYDQSLGPSIVRYTLESGEPFLANQVSPLEVIVESLSQREMNFNLIIAAANASLIADGQSSIQVNNTAIEIPVSLKGLHEKAIVIVHFRMNEDASGCLLKTAAESSKSRPLVTGSIEDAVSI